MIDVIILWFLLKRIGRLADSVNENPRKWKLMAIVGWFIFEILGGNLILLAAGMDFQQAANNIHVFGLVLIFGMLSGYLGFLLVESALKKKNQDITM